MSSTGMRSPTPLPASSPRALAPLSSPLRFPAPLSSPLRSPTQFNAPSSTSSFMSLLHRSLPGLVTLLVLFLCIFLAAAAFTDRFHFVNSSSAKDRATINSLLNHQMELKQTIAKLSIPDEALPSGKLQEKLKKLQKALKHVNYAEEFPPINHTIVDAYPAPAPPPPGTQLLKNVCVEDSRIVVYDNAHVPHEQWFTAGLGNKAVDFMAKGAGVWPNRNVTWHRLGVFYHGSCPANFGHMILDTCYPILSMLKKVGEIEPMRQDTHAIFMGYEPEKSSNGCHGRDFSWLIQTLGFPSHTLSTLSHPTTHCYKYAYVGQSIGHNDRHSAEVQNKWAALTVKNMNVTCPPLPPGPRKPRVTAVYRPYGRRVLNWPDLMAVMDQFQFDITEVDFDTLTWRQQIEMLHCHTDFWMGIDGAAFTLYPLIQDPLRTMLVFRPHGFADDFWNERMPPGMNVKRYQWQPRGLMDVSKDAFNWACYHKFEESQASARRHGAPHYTWMKCQDMRVDVNEVVQLLHTIRRERFSDVNTFLSIEQAKKIEADKKAAEKAEEERRKRIEDGEEDEEDEEEEDTDEDDDEAAAKRKKLAALKKKKLKEQMKRKTELKKKMAQEAQKKAQAQKQAKRAMTDKKRGAQAQKSTKKGAQKNTQKKGQKKQAAKKPA